MADIKDNGAEEPDKSDELVEENKRKRARGEPTSTGEGEPSIIEEGRHPPDLSRYCGA